jgi:hypothetical protein
MEELVKIQSVLGTKNKSKSHKVKKQQKSIKNHENTPVLVETVSSSTPRGSTETEARDCYQYRAKKRAKKRPKVPQRELHTFLDQIRAPKWTRRDQRTSREV